MGKDEEVSRGSRPGRFLVPPSLVAELPNDPSSAFRARRALNRFEPAIPRDLLDDARLLVSEVVTNAFRHASDGGPIRLRAFLAGGRLRVEVENDGTGRPKLLSAQDRQEGRGLGLFVVDRVASRWGSTPSPYGWLVWFELDLTT
jgi:anti-sigma regulatory factor (Ser/Thr protein kinase)